ncbi:MAG: LemA family protein [Bacteroidetes bacterium HGW-Bacteroidetes-6]|nr:MAG: LemA family protein [Bacteroidetes bacterium HGW-Bacteroidetes-6]
MIIILLVVILLPIGIWMWRANNRMVVKEEALLKQWANVENVYQKRMDLVGNLVNTVKGMADFEKSTLTAVIDARSKASSININADNLDEETFSKFEQAQDEFSGSLSKLMVVMEQYPVLQAPTGFLNLMNDLKGIESEILVQRNAYNEVAMDYNQYIRTFPRNLFAALFGFDKKGYFQSSAGAENAPKVEF